MSIHSTRPAFAILAVILAFAPDSVAATQHDSDSLTLRPQADADSATAAPDRSPGYFDKGSVAIYLQGMYYMDVERQDTTIGGAAVGLGYYVDDNWSWNFQLAGYDLQQEDHSDTAGGSFDILLRHHFVNRDPWTVFIDGGLGFFAADDHFPVGGTHQNFTMQAGFGLTRRVSESMHLMGAARWFHVSNARRKGREENPHTDGIGAFFGVMWTR